MSTNRNPFPPEAQQVFKGKIFEVWQWEQKMFDGTTATFERLKRPNTAQIIPIVGDKILVLTEEQPDTRQPFISVPGGRCEEGEDSLQAAKRELLEETGYESDDWELWLELHPVAKIQYTLYTYVARNCVKVAEPALDAGEKITSQLVSFEEFLLLSDNPVFYEKEVINEMLRARLDPEKKSALHRKLFGEEYV